MHFITVLTNRLHNYHLAMHYITIMHQIDFVDKDTHDQHDSRTLWSFAVRHLTSTAPKPLALSDSSKVRTNSQQQSFGRNHWWSCCAATREEIYIFGPIRSWKRPGRLPTKQIYVQESDLCLSHNTQSGNEPRTETDGSILQKWECSREGHATVDEKAACSEKWLTVINIIIIIIFV